MKTKILSLFALSALLFASCSSDEDAYDDSAPKPVQFTTKVEVQGISTRVAVPTWNVNDAIGIYMLKNGTDSISENATNKKYVTTSGNGTFTATGNEIIYYPVDATKKVDFIAYYPHSISVNNWIYPINLSTQTNQSAIDFMYADKVTNKDKSSTSVNLNFSHKLVKVIFNVTAGSGISNLSGLTVKIKNVKTSGSVDLKTGTISQDATKVDVTPYSSLANRFEAILLPISAFTSDNIIEFTLNGDTYVWAMNSPGGTIASLDGGTMYSYSITINKTGISGVTATITDWNYQSGSGVAL